jgi:small subunit ribosomal protein S1
MSAAREARMNTDENSTTPEEKDLLGQGPSEQQGGGDSPAPSADTPSEETREGSSREGPGAESGGEQSASEPREAEQASEPDKAERTSEPREAAQASEPDKAERASEPREAAQASEPDEAEQDPAPPQKAASGASSKSDDDWEEEPGDDIGNRIPDAGGGAGGQWRFGQPGRQGARPQPSPKPQQRQERGPAHQAKPVHQAKPAQQPRPAPQAAQAPQATKPASDGGGAEGEAPATDAGAAATPAEGGAAPAKKRRRRRRKGGGAGAQQQAPGAEGAQAAAGAEEEGADEGAEEGAEGAAEGAEGSADEGGEAQGGEAQGGEAQGGEKRRRPKGQSAAAAAAAAAARERPAFSIGEEVFGKVCKITPDAIWIDIAGKATGLFDRRELAEEEPPVEGDQFIATVASTGVRGGMLVLSRATARLDEARTMLEAASKSGEPVTGFVTGAVKGGLEVDIGGVRAFAPASHVDLRHGADLSYLVGQRLDFIVTQYAKKGRDVVVSRKKMLEEDAHQARLEAMSKIEPGSVHKGIVRKVVAWGAFVTIPEAGGVEGLIHMTEASHDRGARLNDLFRPGAEIEVKVLRVDEKGKLWLSRKAVTADPWDAVKEKYSVGSRHKGKVARLQPFGAFIELEPGIDGLIHTADLSLKPIQHPQEVVKVGDEIDIIVNSCDSANRKIGLHPAPPAGEESEPRQRLQQGKMVKVAVVQATEGGLVVRVLGVTGRSSRAFIPAGHTGTQRGTDLRKEFPVDTRLEAKVLEVDPRRGEAKLSIRALKEDAEKQAYQQYRAGVAREAKFGTFADLMKKS